MRQLLVAAQLAAVVVLLTAAELFIRSFTSLLRLDLGFDRRGVLTFNFSFSEEMYDTKEKQWALIDAVLDTARRLPGAVAAGAAFSAALRSGRHRQGAMSAGCCPFILLRKLMIVGRASLGTISLAGSERR